MTSIFLFLAGIGAFGGWWLAKQRLTARPWLEEGAAGEFPGTEALSIPAAKIGLGIFLAVVGALFALFISAYSMRMGMPDWRSVPMPRLLWPNTGMLIMSSVALQWGVVAARRDDLDVVRVCLLAGGAFSVAFLAGQVLVWRQLTDGGYLLAGNPANSFFYLITGLHGLHMLGGLVALGRTVDAAWRSVEPDRLRQSIELCALYWHFLLLVWLVLMNLLTGWADDIVAVCRALLT
jgi:cytochrome c oxidase subunit III